MLRNKLQKGKGVAGLNLLLSVVSLLFVIGIIVMAFMLVGSELRDADAVDGDAETVINDTMDAMGESTTFFSIIIIIASVVVLILLIVVIINSLRQSGLIGGGA